MNPFFKGKFRTYRDFDPLVNRSLIVLGFQWLKVPKKKNILDLMVIKNKINPYVYNVDVDALFEDASSEILSRLPEDGQILNFGGAYVQERIEELVKNSRAIKRRYLYLLT